jgi:hypothetical protein
MSTDCNPAIVKSCLSGSFRKDNVLCALLSDGPSVFEASQNSLLGSESNLLALTASLQLLKSKTIPRSTWFNGQGIVHLRLSSEIKYTTYETAHW